MKFYRTWVYPWPILLSLFRPDFFLKSLISFRFYIVAFMPTLPKIRWFFIFVLDGTVSSIIGLVWVNSAPFARQLLVEGYDWLAFRAGGVNSSALEKFAGFSGHGVVHSWIGIPHIHRVAGVE